MREYRIVARKSDGTGRDGVQESLRSESAPPSAHVTAANSLARSNPSGSPGSTKPRTSSSRFRYATTRLWNRNSASATGIARKPFALQAVRSLRSERAQSRSPESEGWCERVISRTSVSLAATSAGCATRVCSSRSVTASIVPPLARQHSVKLGPAPHRAARPRRIGPKLEPLPLGALRVSTRRSADLRVLGFERIGDLVARPRAPLTLRFGPELGRRIDQARPFPETASPSVRTPHRCAPRQSPASPPDRLSKRLSTPDGRRR